MTETHSEDGNTMREREIIKRKGYLVYVHIMTQKWVTYRDTVVSKNNALCVT